MDENNQNGHTLDELVCKNLMLSGKCDALMLLFEQLLTAKQQQLVNLRSELNQQYTPEQIDAMRVSNLDECQKQILKRAVSLISKVEALFIELCQNETTGAKTVWSDLSNKTALLRYVVNAMVNNT